MGSFVQPQIRVGDRVLYYSNPDNPQKSIYGIRGIEAGGLDHKYFSVCRRCRLYYEAKCSA